MKTEDLRKKSVKELKQELSELYREQFNLRMQRGAGQIPRPHLFSKNKKNIARVNTIMCELASAKK